MTHSTTQPSPADFQATVAYVQRKLATQPFWLTEIQAEITWKHARRDPVTLAQWLERWLDPTQRQQLNAALRAARKRRRDGTGERDPAVNVTLSRRAWKILSDLARHDGVTLSAWLIQRHEREWLQL
jgi:macrodomain Ter protein organizer (MatP/YcbG family)